MNRAWMYIKRSTLPCIMGSFSMWWHVEKATTDLDLVKIFQIKWTIKTKLINHPKFISKKGKFIVHGLLMALVASGTRAHIQPHIYHLSARREIHFNRSQFWASDLLVYVFKISILCFFHKYNYLCKYFTSAIFTKRNEDSLRLCVTKCIVVTSPWPFQDIFHVLGFSYYVITQQYIPDIII